jgi:hypothetical protein
MQKAHIYEALLLVNQGVDEAVRGLERLKRVKASGLNRKYFDEKLILLEMQRASLNGFFCNYMGSAEQQDEARFSELHGEYETRDLDEVQVYRNVRALEDRRRLEGKSPKVRFFNEQEQAEWELQHGEASANHGLRGRDDKAEGHNV